MKPAFLSTVLLACIAMVFHSCCTKSECSLAYSGIAFTGFSAQELDTVMLIVENIDGTSPRDTIHTSAVFYDQDSVRASLVQTLPFSKRNRYIVLLPATGAQYRIEGYEFSQEVCNKCFPASSGDHYDKLEAYHVNDVRKQGDQFEIEK